MRKSLWISGICLGAAVPVVAQTIPTLSCRSTTAQLNTGVSLAVPPATSGTVLGLNSADPVWTRYRERTSTPLTPPSDAAAWVQARTTGTVDPAWATPAGAQWLSPGFPSVNGTFNQSAANNWWPRPTPAATPYYNHYRVQFNLAPEVPPAAVNLDLQYLGDDSVTAAFVNGIAQNPFTVAPYTGSVHANFTTGWVTGLNTLVFSVPDTGWAAGFLARAFVAGQSICNISPISVTKTSDKTHYLPGETAVYTVTVASLGLVDVSGVALTDPVPAGLASPVWACAASGGAICPNPAGPMPRTFDLPGQSGLTFTLTGTVTGRDTLNNAATIAPGTGGVCAATTGCTASANPTYTNAPPVAVPALAPWGLAFLAGGVGMLAWRRRRV